MSDKLHILAQTAGLGWGGLQERPELVAQRENAVFRSRLSDARPVALRLHREGYQSDAAIEEELSICQRLADAGFACPWPYPTDQGRFVHKIGSGATRASVVQWLAGVPLARLPEDDRNSPAMFRAIGALMADLHLTADMILPPVTQRPHWSVDALIGPTPLWGNWLEDAALSASDKDMIAVSHDLVRHRLSLIPPGETGLIHADALPDNILQHDGTLYLIDFDDCGVGYRLYDLATALLTSLPFDQTSGLADAMQAGYLSAGGPLRPEAFEDLMVFVMLRAQASAGWSLNRLSPENTRRAAYRERALAITSDVLTNA